MGIEIERKFLVANDEWRPLVQRSLKCLQGYVGVKGKGSIRVRILGNRGFLTLKGPRIRLSRAEFEYPIPLADAEELLASFCHYDAIAKIRHQVFFEGKMWEIDEFLQQNSGLVLAEVELENENQPLSLPGWVGREVSLDDRYFNANLAKNPFTNWRD